MENITLNNQDYANISSVVYDGKQNLANHFTNNKKYLLQFQKEVLIYFSFV